MIQGHILRTYAKDLNNLSIQETRLDKRFQRELAELNRIQVERHEQERIALRQVAQLYMQSKKENKLFNPAQLGFEFSIEEIELFIQACGSSRTAQMPPRALAS